MAIAKSYTYRIGEGDTKTFTAMGPTKREDGTALSKDEIAHYIRYLRYYDQTGSQVGNELTQAVTLVEDASTPEYDGSFDEVVDIDSVAGAGVYLYEYTTMDTGGRESARSDSVELIVLPPFALPLPPVVS